MPIDPDHFSL